MPHYPDDIGLPITCTRADNLSITNTLGCEKQYSQTSLVSTPGDPANCYSLSVVLANHID